jgi:hypothetical protein
MLTFRILKKNQYFLALKYKYTIMCNDLNNYNNFKWILTYEYEAIYHGFIKGSYLHILLLFNYI